MDKPVLGIPEMSNASTKPEWMKTLKAPKKEPVMATFVAEGGMGKTTLASLWPSPIFIPIEDGSAALVGRDCQPAFFPVPGDAEYTGNCSQIGSDYAIECMERLAEGGHPFKTVVLDSITRLSDIVEDEIVDAAKGISIKLVHGGFGAGYGAMANKHEKIRKIAGYLKSKGMHVVFLAHATSEKVSPPDAQEFTRYTIRMHKDSLTHYSDNVDLVAFIKLQTFVNGAVDATDKSQGKAGKAVTSGKRIITCYPTPSHISKNRYSITKDLDFVEGTNPFAAIL